MSAEPITVNVAMTFFDGQWFATVGTTEWVGQGRTPEESLTSAFRWGTELIEAEIDEETLRNRRKASAIKFWAHCLAWTAVEMADKQSEICQLCAENDAETMSALILLMQSRHDLQNVYDLISVNLQREAITHELTLAYVETVSQVGQ